MAQAAEVDVAVADVVAQGPAVDAERQVVRVAAGVDATARAVVAVAAVVTEKVAVIVTVGAERAVPSSSRTSSLSIVSRRS